MEHEIRDAVPLVTFVSVATGRYLDFWRNQISSARNYLDTSARLEFVVLTDLTEELEGDLDVLFSGTNWTLKIGFVPHQEWPFPTLYKFKHINQHKGLLTGEVVWHLDADMLFSDKGIELELSQVSGEGKMVLVKHPGYFRNKGMKKFFIYLFHLSLFFRDSKSLLFESGIGTWEKNEQSLAFVPKNSRKQYVCGGSWGGKRKIFLDFSTDLENRIDQDLTIKIVARFHDESHINWYLANHSCIVLDPSYCFEESYSHLVSVKKRIVAVNKSSSLVWER